MPAAGQAALDQADSVLGGFTSFLAPQIEPADGAGAAARVVRESIGGGIWAVVQHEIAAGREAGLPELAPEIVEFAIAPFVALDEAEAA